MTTHILKTQKLCKNFGGLTAIANLDLAITEGEIRGLIGPNGAGKTTVFNLISGYYKPTSGKIWLHGREITGLKPNVVAGLGAVRTFQASVLFQEMSVLENVTLGFHLQVRPNFFCSLLNTHLNRHQNQAIAEKGAELLEFMGLDSFKDEKAKNLPHGKQRTLAVTIGLAANPKLLLLDEPFTGMNPIETLDMANRIKNAKERMKLSVLIVEHNMKAVLEISDKITVLNYGRKIAEGEPDEIVGNKEVIEAYLGIDEGINNVF
jgi:branched-chain amino acid transport system ATP-binding protein